MTRNDLNDNFKSILFTDNQIVKTNTAADSSSTVAATVRTVFVIKQSEKNDTATALVSGIAKACQLDDDAFVLLPDTISWKTLRHLTNIKEIILLGVSEADINVNISLPLHYSISFDDKTWIKSVDIATLNTNKDAKAALWNKALKKHFLDS